MKRIPLSKQGKHRGKYFALVDDEDFEKLSKYRWNFSSSGGYAERRVANKVIRMHTFLIGVPKGMMVDHKNCNGLDNRKKNLRVCSKSQNMMNRGKTKTNKSGYKGDYFEEFTNRWKAQIKIGNRNTNLGRFDSAKEAAVAYNKACKIYHGEFANLNKI